MNAWRMCFAPMLDWTTPECRRIFRFFSSDVRFYTEMVTTGAILHGDVARHLHHEKDMPCALQLGGGDPDELAKACEIAQHYQYDEINLNAGCPSDRVQNNAIGACLMRKPKHIAQCLNAMQKASDVPITLKHRLSIDEMDEASVLDFVDCIVNESACRHLIIHARKAWLNGLSPRENRDIPPLKYDLVYAVKERYPDCTIILNGGIANIDEAEEHLQKVDGVMLGRAIYYQPQLLLESARLFGKQAPKLEDVLSDITTCMSEQVAQGTPLWHYTRHLLGLFSSCRGAKQYRRILSEESRNDPYNIHVWNRALAAVGMR